VSGLTFSPIHVSNSNLVTVVVVSVTLRLNKPKFT